MYSKVLLIPTLSILAFLGCFYAQKVSAAPSLASISVNMVPENPAPGEAVSITLSSYANDLDTISISWSINGVNTLSGIGKKSFSLKAPEAGKEVSVLIRLLFPDGEVELRVLVKPSTMIMLWQATDSYVPPFYKGKAMPTPESSIKVVAMPEIRTGSSMVSPKNMAYAWKINYNNDQGSSGYGKNFLIYQNDYLDGASVVGVTATTIDQKYSASSEVNIGTSDPKIVFYKRDPMMGTIFERAIPDRYKIENEEMLEAVPYFISPKNPLHPFLTWTWSINDQTVAVPRLYRNLIPLKADSGLSGTARLRLEIENTQKIFQTADKELNIEF